MIFSLTFASTANEMTVEFVSDFAVSGSGFIMTWSAFVPLAGGGQDRCPMRTLVLPKMSFEMPMRLDSDGLTMLYAGPMTCAVRIIAPGETEVNSAS